MKSSLTLSSVLFALSLSSTAFANGAPTQTPQSLESTVAVPAARTASVTEVADTNTVTRSVMERLQFEVRQSVLGSLRDSGLQVLKLAAPVLAESIGSSVVQVDLTQR